jgi:hypothetical protein
MEHVLGVQAGQPKVKKQERGLKAGGALGGTRFTGWQQIKEQMEYYIGFDLSHSSVADTAKWQQPNALRRATENPSFRYYEVTVSRKGHVTTQNTDRVILARGVEIAKSSAGCVSALECGTRLFRRAG